jgi:hypothetical protein
MPEGLFGKYKDLVKITSYDSLKKALGEDPRKVYKREMILRENQ